MTKILFGALVSWCVLFPSEQAFAEEDGDILDFIPAIIAGTLPCDPAAQDDCSTEVRCVRNGGYWYWGRCNTDPRSLASIRRLAGTWDFYYRDLYGNQSAVYTFHTSSIRKTGGNSYEILGVDEYGRDITATYVIVEVEFINIKLPSDGIKYPHLSSHYWFMDYTDKNNMSGRHQYVNAITAGHKAWASRR